MRNLYVYILASQRNGTMYVGVTNDLIRRVWEHRNSTADGFTQKHGIQRLVWYEAHADANVAIAREKQIKRWRRAWKITLIEAENSGWNDLSETLIS